MNFTGPDGFGSSLLSADNFFNLTDLGVCADCAPTKYPHWAMLISYTGELWLAFNDDAYSGNTSDNSGQVTATITVTHA